MVKSGMFGRLPQLHTLHVCSNFTTVLVGLHLIADIKRYQGRRGQIVSGQSSDGGSYNTSIGLAIYARIRCRVPLVFQSLLF